jgi:hypothetical protein
VYISIWYCSSSIFQVFTKQDAFIDEPAWKSEMDLYSIVRWSTETPTTDQTLHLPLNRMDGTGSRPLVDDLTVINKHVSEITFTYGRSFTVTSRWVLVLPFLLKCFQLVHTHVRIIRWSQSKKEKGVRVSLLYEDDLGFCQRVVESR